MGDLSKKELRSCQLGLTELRSMLENAEQFRALVVLGIKEIAVWNPSLLSKDRPVAEAEINFVLNRANYRNDQCLKITQSALELVRDALRDGSIFHELSVIHGARRFILLYAPDRTSPTAACTHMDDVLIHRHTRTARATGLPAVDTEWALRLWKGKPEIVRKG